MKYWVSLLFLLLSSCVQPPSSGSNPNLYFSQMGIINGVNTICLNCLVMEMQQISVRLSFGSNPDESCSNAGTAFYTNTNNQSLTLPTATNQNVVWDVVTVANNHPTCFPQNMSVSVDYIDATHVQVTFNGKSYEMKQSN